MKILITETAHLIWATRCERVIQGKEHSEAEITKRWYRAINNRLAEDKIIATKIKRGKLTTRLVTGTWKKLIQKTRGTLPDNWLYRREVLVGMRV
jgi:hypothetical protein